MSSVIASARRSTASAFDLVYAAADTTAQLINVASLGVSALDAKARLMHTRVVTHAKAQAVVVEDDEITKAATEHTDLMEQVHKTNYPGQPFDRAAHFISALAKIQAALAA